MGNVNVANVSISIMPVQHNHRVHKVQIYMNGKRYQIKEENQLLFQDYTHQSPKK